MNVEGTLGTASSLFYEPKDREKWDNFLTVALSKALQRIPDGPVSPTMDVGVFKTALQGFDFQSPRPLSELLPWAIETLEGGVVHPQHPPIFRPVQSIPVVSR